MVKKLNCYIVVSKYEIHLLYYVDIWKGMNSLIPTAIVYTVLLLFFYKDDVGIK